LKKIGTSNIRFNDLGLSILEISHRSKDFVAVMDEADHLLLNY
jgi:phosphoserine aminotransferase